MNLNDIDSKLIYEEVEFGELSDKQLLDAVAQILAMEDRYKVFKQFRILKLNGKDHITSTGNISIEPIHNDEMSDFLEKPE